MQPSQDAVKFKVVILGEYGVGKTALHRRYTAEQVFSTTRAGATIGVDYGTRSVRISSDGSEAGASTVVLQVWDTAGSERFGGAECLSRLLTRNVDGALLTFSLTDRASFDKLAQWHGMLHERAAADGRGTKPCCIVVGTKLDLADDRQAPARAVSAADARALADSLGAEQYVETSAKTMHNVEEVFALLARRLVAQGARLLAAGDEAREQSNRPDNSSGWLTSWSSLLPSSC